MITKYILHFAALALLVSCSTDQKKEDTKQAEVSTTGKSYSVLIGTYGKTESDGIFTTTLSSDGKIEKPTLAISVGDPSFLILNDDQSTLVSVSESGGGIVSFDVDGDNLTLKDSASSGGNGPCYVSINKKGDKVFAANYGDGMVSAIGLSGSELNFLNNVQQEGATGEYNRKGPHAHAILEHPSNELVYSPDLGADKVFIYSYSEEGLVPHSIPFAELAEGSGPRHIDFSADGKFAYVITELSNQIVTFEVNNDGGLNPIQTISTIPEGYTETTYCADIHVHPSGKFVYGSNRGHDSIVGFSVKNDGTLELIGFANEGINWPRNFGITPDGSFMIVANQKGDDIVPFKINSDGSLTVSGNSVKVPKPVCILFK